MLLSYGRAYEDEKHKTFEQLRVLKETDGWVQNSKLSC